MKGFISYLSRNQFIAALFLIVLGWFLIRIKEILIVLFISYILMTSLQPAVIFLKKKNISHALSATITYLLLLAFILLLVLPILPFFVSQIQSLAVNFPKLLHNASKTIGIGIDYSVINDSISSFLGVLGKNIIFITGKVFGGFLSVLTVLVVSFYLLLYHDRFEKLIVNLFPKEEREKTQEVFERIELKLGHWVRGQLVLSLFIGVITWVFLTLVGIKFALPLAFLAGLLEIIPTIGPIISSIPAIIVALTVSPALAIAVAAGYIVIQAIENNILVPKVMQAAVGLNPVVIIAAILIGGNLLGILGALLSIPFLTVLTIIFRALQE
ncbi:MAG: hypothetical protein A2958_02995 [Candidatus Levybacteria bacterium RIFCSPLOWO2_01_FULL_38_13]|nr:MAG: hypothetical protein A2629_03410 [Candidatus Levybacteria bacterium RIFCSPHIGHO2_01_FULL_41_15]OGH35292.1 MAG: hypothetical protein A2958_02995 [Candidatus Levybacteria bacterium RIFCSPLOWO2_01_FULL_38_13]